jgi:hypothetical protein
VDSFPRRSSPQIRCPGKWVRLRAPPVRRGVPAGGPHTAISGHGDGGEAIGERTGGAKGAGSVSSGLVLAEAKTTVTESSRTRVIPSRRSHPSCRTGAATFDLIKLALLGATRHRAGRASPATWLPGRTTGDQGQTEAIRPDQRSIEWILSAVIVRITRTWSRPPYHG